MSISLTATRLDLTGVNAIDQRADWMRELYLYSVAPTDPGDPDTGTYYDITGCTLEAQIRVNYYDEDGTAISITPITLNPAKLQLILTHETTAALSTGTRFWDLFITWPSGLRDKVLFGEVSIISSVTRPA